MKVEQKDGGFSPITLTIKSQKEVDLFTDLVCLASSKINDSELNKTLREVALFFINVGTSDSYTYIDGHQMQVIAKQPNTQ